MENKIELLAEKVALYCYDCSAYDDIYNIIYKSFKDIYKSGCEDTGNYYTSKINKSHCIISENTDNNFLKILDQLYDYINAKKIKIKLDESNKKRD